MPTASKIASDFKIVTDLIVFLYSFFFLVGTFVLRNELINTTDSNNRHQFKQVACSRPIYGPDRPIDFAIGIAYCVVKTLF